VKKPFNIQDLLHCKSKRHGTKPMHPSSSRACQRYQRTHSEASQFGGSHNYKTKQNKLPSLIDIKMGEGEKLGKKSRHNP
jgi:hypothetical protein